jgi:hypothetical protein
MKRLALLISVASLVLASCKRDGCNEPLAFNYDPEGTTSESCVWQPLEVEVEYAIVYGDDKVVFGNQLTTDDGRSIQFDHIGVYLTEHMLIDGGKAISLGSSYSDCTARTDDALLLLDTNRTYRGAYLPNSNSDITALRFHVGVDSCRNDSLDPSTQLSGPFAPQVPTMYWSWASGYRFISLDGYVDASDSANGTDIKFFEYHTGLNALLRTVELPIEQLESQGNVVHLTVRLDLKVLLDQLDFTVDLSTHTMDNMPLAMKITDNALLAFTLE